MVLNDGFFGKFSDIGRIHINKYLETFSELEGLTNDPGTRGRKFRKNRRLGAGKLIFRSRSSFWARAHWKPSKSRKKSNFRTRETPNKSLFETAQFASALNLNKSPLGHNIHFKTFIFTNSN